MYAQAISAKIKFSINTGSKDLSVSGSLKMKKDDVIRIQLTPLGLMEAGRIEFTKDYVLVVDRINKEYIKASYSDVDFCSATDSTSTPCRHCCGISSSCPDSRR